MINIFVCVCVCVIGVQVKYGTKNFGNASYGFKRITVSNKKVI